MRITTVTKRDAEELAKYSNPKDCVQISILNNDVSSYGTDLVKCSNKQDQIPVDKSESNIGVLNMFRNGILKLAPFQRNNTKSKLRYKIMMRDVLQDKNMGRVSVYCMTGQGMEIMDGGHRFRGLISFMTNKICALFEMNKGGVKAFIQIWYSEIGEGASNIDPQLIGEQPVEALNLYIKDQQSVCIQCNTKKERREDGTQEFGCYWHDPNDLFGNRYAICTSCWEANKNKHSEHRTTYIQKTNSSGTITHNRIMSPAERECFDHGLFLMEEYKEFKDRRDLADQYYRDLNSYQDKFSTGDEVTNSVRASEYGTNVLLKLEDKRCFDVFTDIVKRSGNVKKRDHDSMMELSSNSNDNYVCQVLVLYLTVRRGIEMENPSPNKSIVEYLEYIGKPKQSHMGVISRINFLAHLECETRELRSSSVNATCERLCTMLETLHSPSRYYWSQIFTLIYYFSNHVANVVSKKRMIENSTFIDSILANAVPPQSTSNSVFEKSTMEARVEKIDTLMRTALL